MKAAIGSWLQDRVMFSRDFLVLRHIKLTAAWKSMGYSDEILAEALYRNAEAYFGCAGPTS